VSKSKTKKLLVYNYSTPVELLSDTQTEICKSFEKSEGELSDLLRGTELRILIAKALNKSLRFLLHAVKHGNGINSIESVRDMIQSILEEPKHVAIYGEEIEKMGELMKKWEKLVSELPITRRQAQAKARALRTKANKTQPKRRVK
jgi:DNA repair ATPase RecN